MIVSVTLDMDRIVSLQLTRMFGVIKVNFCAL